MDILALESMNVKLHSLKQNLKASVINFYYLKLRTLVRTEIIDKTEPAELIESYRPKILFPLSN